MKTVILTRSPRGGVIVYACRFFVSDPLIPLIENNSAIEIREVLISPGGPELGERAVYFFRHDILTDFLCIP